MTDSQGTDAERDALLALLLADEGLEPVASATIPKRADGDPAALSFAQQRMWFLDQFEDDTAALGIRSAIRIRGALDVGVLRRSLETIVERHEILRTVIVSDAGEPRPIVRRSVPLPMIIDDVAGDETLVTSLLATEATRTFDLEREPPLLVRLIRVDVEHHVLSLVIHHVASDGWSLRVFFHELDQLYVAYSAGRPSPLPDLPIQYQDYASWQRGAASEIFRQQLDYWSEQLAGPLPVFEIPPDFRRPARHTFAGGQVEAEISPQLTKALNDLGRRSGATMFMVMLAAFEIVVSRHAGQTDVLIGTPIAGRVRPELEPMIGVFLNTLVLRNDLGDDPTFLELLERVRETSLSAFANQDVPFEQLLGELQVTRDLSRTPMFQILFNMTNFGGGVATQAAEGLLNLDHEVLAIADVGAKFDITLYIDDRDDGQHALLVYNRSLYAHATMQHLMDQYVSVLEQVAQDPDLPIAAYSLVTASAAAILPHPTEHIDDAWHGSVPESVLRSAARVPDRIAVRDATSQWTYGVLATQMTGLARWLRLHGVGKGDVVAIHGHRSASLVWAVTGVLASGAAYLLLDPQYPPARLRQYLRIAKPAAMLTVGEGVIDPALEAELDDLRVAVRRTLPPLADLEAELDLREGRPHEPLPDIGPDDSACLTFTSGSEGSPKAVLGQHGSLTHFFPWMSQHFDVTEADRFSMLSGLAHDPLQRDMFWPLWLGATLVVPDPESMSVSGWLATWMRDEAVTVAHLTPAMGQLVAEGVDADAPFGGLDVLRRAFFIGDVLTRRDVVRLRRLAPGVLVVNLYGATETQRASGFHVVDPHDLEDEAVKEVLPLGTAMPGVQLLIRTAKGDGAGVGEIGEIYVRSPHLALGYADDPALTAARFVDAPSFVSGADRMYRTGDRGRYRNDGSIEFFGRADQQVQLRGFRIEIGEIQAILGRHAQVRDAVVQLVDHHETPQLAAYIVPADPDALDTADIRNFLRRELPSHMVPSSFLRIDSVPLTPNGKVDRRALPPLEKPERSAGSRSPRDAIERTLLEIWSDVLDQEGIGIDDDFFALGGYSLLATRLFALLEERTGQRLPVAVLFEHPTIAELAAAIRDDDWRTDWSSLVAIQPAGGEQPFFYVAPYMISVLELAHLGDELGHERPLYGLQPQGLDGTVPPHTTIEAMAAHYIDEIKTVQPTGPYAIGGHCAGSWVAFEMVRQLEAAGDEVSTLTLVDQGPPGIERPPIRALSYIANRVRFYFSGGRLRQAIAWEFKILTGRILLRRVGSPTARFQERVKQAHRAAHTAYQGGRIRHDITLVLSEDTLSLPDKAWYRRWADLTDGEIITRNVGGTHANLLVQPFVRELANEISLSLDASTSPSA